MRPTLLAFFNTAILALGCSGKTTEKSSSKDNPDFGTFGRTANEPVKGALVCDFKVKTNTLFKTLKAVTIERNTPPYLNIYKEHFKLVLSADQHEIIVDFFDGTADELRSLVLKSGESAYKKILEMKPLDPNIGYGYTSSRGGVESEQLFPITDLKGSVIVSKFGDSYLADPLSPNLKSYNNSCGAINVENASNQVLNTEYCCAGESKPNPESGGGVLTPGIDAVITEQQQKIREQYCGSVESFLGVDRNDGPTAVKSLHGDVTLKNNSIGNYLAYYNNHVQFYFNKEELFYRGKVAKRLLTDGLDALEEKYSVELIQVMQLQKSQIVKILGASVDPDPNILKYECADKSFFSYQCLAEDCSELTVGVN